MQELALNQLASSTTDTFHIYYSAFNPSRPDPGRRQNVNLYVNLFYISLFLFYFLQFTGWEWLTTA